MYNIVFFAVACGITVFFLAGCIGAVCVHRKKLRVFGLLYNIFAIVLWAAVLLLAAVLILLKLKVQGITVDGDALLLWGVRVPELGHILRLCEYTVGMILLGASVVLGALSFILNFCRRPVAILTPEVAAESDGQTAAIASTQSENETEAPQQPADAVEESDAPTDEEQPEEVADTAEAVDAQETATDTAEESEADATEEIETQGAVADTAEEVEPQETDIAQESEPQGAEIEKDVADGAQASDAETETAEAVDDVDEPIDIPEYRPQVNVYRDLLGKLNDVLDDAISGVQPEEVKAEVVAVKRERKPKETREVRDEEIALVGYDTLQTPAIRTIVRRTGTTATKTVDNKTVTPQKPPVKRAPKASEEVAVTHDAVAPSEALMTRRHVIMNRSNVVNMFSEYLKSRNEEEKERLEGSINTIIIK